MTARDMLDVQCWSAVNGWQTSGSMNEVRNSDGVVLCPDMNDTADWNSGLRIAVSFDQVEVTNINTDFINM